MAYASSASPKWNAPQENRLITCQLTKLEVALDQVKKSETSVVPADAALLASALTLAGRQALALYEGEQYVWPEDYERLTAAMRKQIELIQEGIDSTAPKRVAKNAPEEEAIPVTVGLMPNYSAGERLLEGRDDLKTKLSDILQAGVEYAYATNDIYWQWALDRANWNTVTNKEISRRIKVKASFTEGAVGIELGIGGTKKRARKVHEPDPEPEPIPEPDIEIDVNE